MRTFRRGLAVVLGLALVVLTVAFAMRWVDVATREVAAVQAAVPITGAGVVVVTLLALVCGLRRLALVGAVPGAVAVVLAVASFGLTAAPSGGGAETVTVLSSNLEFGGGNADDVVKGVRDHQADVVVLVALTPQAVTRLLDSRSGRGTALRRRPRGSRDHGSRDPQPVAAEPHRRGQGSRRLAVLEPHPLVARPAGAFRVKAVHTRQPIVSARGWERDLDRLHTWQLAQPTDQPLVMAGDFNASQATRRSGRCSRA